MIFRALYDTVPEYRSELRIFSAHVRAGAARPLCGAARAAARLRGGLTSSS